jgi:hypothetical protein
MNITAQKLLGGRVLFLLIFTSVAFFISINFELFNSMFIVSNGQYDYISNHAQGFTLSGTGAWHADDLNVLKNIKSNFLFAKDFELMVAICYKGEISIPIYEGNVFTSEESLSLEDYYMIVGVSRSQEDNKFSIGEFSVQYGNSYRIEGLIGDPKLYQAFNYKMFTNFASIAGNDVLGEISGSYIFDAGPATEIELKTLLSAISKKYPDTVISLQGKVRVTPSLLGALSQNVFSLISIGLTILLLSMNSFSLSALYIKSRAREMAVKSVYGASKINLLIDLYRDILPFSILGFILGFILYIVAREMGLWGLRRVAIQWQAIILAFVFSEGICLQSQLKLFQAAISKNLAQFLRVQL